MYYQKSPGYWYRCVLVSLRPLVVLIEKTGERIQVSKLENLSERYPG